ncbi:hypothetical protein TGVAND_283770 [Toxoplasma gondii VAND]|uniref:Uncharacterized protein n=1 Tax=Toxoplasma gondii VAND TaxID=933077 RepID=A0A086Q6A4_TOXGO|nr:hypothetical protein TGVAND_283770 [Toxoplasma gondii VAND]
MSFCVAPGKLRPFRQDILSDVLPLRRILDCEVVSIFLNLVCFLDAGLIRCSNPSSDCLETLLRTDSTSSRPGFCAAHQLWSAITLQLLFMASPSHWDTPFPRHLPQLSACNKQVEYC